MGNSYDRTAWTTESEVQYIRKIGESIKDHFFNRLSFPARRQYKADMLDKYVTAAEKRKDWGAVNKDTVMRVAAAELRVLKR